MPNNFYIELTAHCLHSLGKVIIAPVRIHNCVNNDSAAAAAAGEHLAHRTPAILTALQGTSYQHNPKTNTS